MDGTDYEGQEAADEALYERFSRGDQAAFSTLYQRYKDRLFGYLVRQLRDEARAEELAQEIWMKVIRHSADYQPTGAFASWLFTLARHRVIDDYRQQKRTPPADDVEVDGVELISAELSPEELAQCLESRQRINEAIQQLSPAQQEALNLRYGAEFSLEAIAEVTNTSRETVKSRLRYGVNKLRGLLRGSM